MTERGDYVEKKSTLIALIAAVIITAVVICCIFADSGDPEISIDRDILRIDCTFGTEINISEIREIKLDERSFDEIAPAWKKTNGFDGFNGSLKGNFQTDDLGKILVYVQKDSKPTIVIKRGGKEEVYISFSKPEETKKIYEAFTALA